MSTTPARPAVDVAPPRRTPAPHLLALVLGILAVPGCTLAWDLPAGGLWIGLPLAIAAIVSGRIARQGAAPARERRMALIGMVLAGLCVLQMVAYVAFA